VHAAAGRWCSSGRHAMSDPTFTVSPPRCSGWLRCHLVRPPPAAKRSRCSHLRLHLAFKPFGAGTQRVIEQLENGAEGLRLPALRIAIHPGREDTDACVAQFAAGEGRCAGAGKPRCSTKGIRPAAGLTLARAVLAGGMACLHRPESAGRRTSLCRCCLQLAGPVARPAAPNALMTIFHQSRRSPAPFPREVNRPVPPIHPDSSRDPPCHLCISPG